MKISHFILKNEPKSKRATVRARVRNSRNWAVITKYMNKTSCKMEEKYLSILA